MNINNNYAKAYVEVLEILRYLPKEEYEKIPKTKIQYYIENCDKNYHFDFDVSKPLNEQQFLKETNTIIVTLFRDYFATSNQKETLQKILLLNEEKRQEKLREQYNTDNLFKKHEKLEQDECMKKLFIFDLDGTLLTSNNQITEESKQAIWKCKKER